MADTLYRIAAPLGAIAEDEEDVCIAGEGNCILLNDRKAIVSEYNSLGAFFAGFGTEGYNHHKSPRISTHGRIRHQSAGCNKPLYINTFSAFMPKFSNLRIVLLRRSLDIVSPAKSYTAQVIYFS